MPTQCILFRSHFDVHVLRDLIVLKFHRGNQKISDPVTRHIIFEQGRVLHDSLDSLSSEDDRRQITRLVARFVQLVSVSFVSKSSILRHACLNVVLS